MTLINQCNYTVWPALSGKGRTLCTTDSIIGKFSCATGDCSSGKMACNGSGGSPPNTLVEFSLDGFNDIDFYDVSLVDGFNLPLIVVPISGSSSNCKSTGCVVDLNAVCPTELKATRNEEVVVYRRISAVFSNS
ncbi:PR5-like receptor kinase [Vigna angularis]|uniref:PR5-like receptor kinase n=1 Tax=Phaseolus angularis TaxID=3914 RepID=UPI000809D8A6|nr:PR5-like receptor kinase [Vigna angularis]